MEDIAIFLGATWSVDQMILSIIIISVPSFPLETRDLSIFSVLRRNELRSIIVQDIIEAKTDSWKDIVFVSFVH